MGDLKTLLERFFALLGERKLDECAALVAEARAAGCIDPRWLDYFQAILYTEQAPPHWDLAEQTLQRVLAANPPADLRARLHLEIAFAADYLGDYNRAIEHDRLSLELFEALGDRVYQAKALKNTGIAHLRAFERGQVGRNVLPDALDCFHRSLAICQELGDERLAATVELHLGIVAKALGRWEEARDRYAARAEKCRRFGWSRSLALTLNNLGEVHYHLGQYAQAEACYREALVILAGLPSPDLYEEADVWANLALTLEAQGQVEAGRRASDRAIGLVEIIRRPLTSETTRLGFFGTRISFYEQRVRLEIEHDRPDVALTTLERAKSRAFIEMLAGRATELAVGPGAATPAAPASLCEVNPLDVTTIQARLPADTLLLEYFATPDYACVFAVTQERLEVIPLAANLEPGSPSGLARLERVWEPDGRHLARLTPDAGGRLHRPWPLAQLHRLLLAPAAGLIGRHRRLCIVPYGPLHYVPFHALVEPGPEIIYAPSATVLLDHCRARPQGRGRGGIVFSYGKDLRYSRGEGATVAARLGGPHCADATATREAVFRTGPDYPILHFACHGYFDHQDPLASGLDLADGRLEAGQIIERLRLQADLVVLSGCETGQSRLHRGDELIGLVRAFIFAGAASVLVSLWPVDDISTRILMERFYERLMSGTAPAGALHRAQLDLMRLTAAELRDRLRADGLPPAEADAELARLRAAGGFDQKEALDTQRLFAHPYYWAPFVLVGDRLG